MQKYYERENFKLFLGDCVEILQKATPESIDMIFAEFLFEIGVLCN